MTTATADPAREPEDPKAKRPGPPQPPVPQPSAPKPPPKPPLKPVAAEGPEGYADDAPPAPEPAPAPAMDDRLVGVGRRLQLLVESSSEHIGELRAIAGVLRPDGAAHGRTEGLLQALEYDKEALGRAIQQLHAAAQGIAGETAGKG